MLVVSRSRLWTPVQVIFFVSRNGIHWFHSSMEIKITEVQSDCWGKTVELRGPETRVAER